MVLSISLEVGAMVYTLCAYGAVFVLWFLSDMRDRALYDSERRKGTFHCIRCDHLYAARAGTETCPCPRCQFRNTRLQF